MHNPPAASTIPISELMAKKKQKKGNDEPHQGTSAASCNNH